MNKVKTALRTVIFLVLAFTFMNGAQAQSRKVIYLQNYNNAPYHFGFLLGVNFMGYTLDFKDGYQDIVHPGDQLPLTENGFYVINRVESKLGPGFSVGVIGDKRLGEYFNLRFIPTLSIGAEKTIEYQYIIDDNIENIREVVSKDKLATYLEFPLQIKYRSKRYNNIGAYLIGGINPKLYLPSLSSKHMFFQDKPALVQINFADVAFEFGTGFDIYNQWFKMGVEIKMSLGLLNVLKTDDTSMAFIYNAPLNKIRNNQLQISFTFE